MKTLTILFLTLTIHSALAEVVAFNLLLRAGESWTVPQNKTAIVTHAARTGGAITTLRLRVYLPQATGAEYAFISADGTFGENINPEPMYFGAGTIFYNPTENIVTVAVIGRLADDGDLFASISSDLETVAVTDINLLTKVTPTTKRPARVTMEESTDLLAWAPSPTAIIERTALGDYDATILKNGDTTKFVRAKVQAKP